MNYEELRTALDGLCAYDTGSVDSGIHDEALRLRCKEHLTGLSADERRVLVARLVTDMWLSDEAIAEGCYGAEDAREFINWLDEQGWLI